MNLLLNNAIRYVKDYKWSIIPVKKDSKLPAVKWKEYQTRLPTQQELTAWFGQPDYSMGLVTGAISSLSVLDVDDPQLSTLLKELNIASPITVKTPRAHHLYFKYCPRLNTTTEIAGVKKLDTRNDGGYVLVPPSGGYHWINGYPILAHLPEFPYSRLPKIPPTATEKEKDSSKDRSKDWIGEALNGLQEGNRDRTFTSIIGRLHRDRYAPNSIVALLAPYAETSQFGVEALTEKVRHISSSYPSQVQVNKDIDEPESFEDFLKDMEPVEWICSPIVAKRAIGFVAGLPESLKTWLMMDLAVECANGGGKWLGVFPVTSEKVLFIDQERFKAETQRRIKQVAAHKGISKLENLFTLCGTSIRLDNDLSYQAFHRRLDKLRPTLVIVDSFGTFHTSDENNRQSIQIVLERIKTLRNEFGCTFVFIEHEGKGVLNPETRADLPTAFKMIGSVGKPAAAEFVLTCRKNSETSVMVYHTKSTLGPSVAPFEAQVKDTPLGISVSVVR